ncbi:MAG TPA: response regulator [Chthoniobacterales bacterium]|nr:response regulator [Chthoniobacterales bacterium]
MNPSLVLLFTRDPVIDRQFAELLSGTGAGVITARDVAGVIQILHQHGRELDLAVLDFDHGTRGMTLLSAIHSWRGELPMIVLTASDSEHASAIAYAHGARACLQKPIATGKLRAVLSLPGTQLAAA